MKNIVVIYHNDLDGFGAAWAAWKKLGNRARYLAMDYAMSAPKGLKNKEIYFLDFCYPLAVMKKIRKEAKSITIIDHHISNKPVLKIADNFSYNINNSSAVLAWKYFNLRKSIPKLLLYIEDEDIWRFKIPFTKELMAFLDISDLKFSQVYEMLKGDYVYGEFYSQYPNLGTVRVRFNTFGRINDDELIFRIKEKSSPGWYYENKYKTDQAGKKD